MPKRAKLTDADWHEVFAIRCRSKQGRPPTPSESRLCTRAWHEDPARYKATGDDVFDATVPFGSTARARREED